MRVWFDDELVRIGSLRIFDEVVDTGSLPSLCGDRAVYIE